MRASVKHLWGLAIATLVAVGGMAGTALADGQSTDASGPASGLQLQEVVVTSRKIAENLQEVPDAITAFNANTITDFGIKSIDDVSSLTPDLLFHTGDAYEPGTFNITMRGIGTATAGWPSVSYIVDGVPQTSTDSMQRGSFEDIERIEVLRGPQSALYGFNAIGGAINVITKRPTNEWNFGADVLYGNGPDQQIGGTLSGPIISDTLLFRLTASYRDDDGLLRSPSNGLDLDFRDWWQVQSKLIFTPVSNLEIAVTGNWDKERDGATYEDKVPSEAYADNFNSAYDARRAYAGEQDRTLYTTAAHIQWDLEHLSFIGVVAFDHVDEQNNSSVCYDDPNDPLFPLPGGGAACLLGPAFGNAATAGEPIDEPFYEHKFFRTLTSDVRIASRGNDKLTWTVGVATLHRESTQGFNVGNLLAPNATYQLLYPDWDVLNDNWWGVYGQLIWHVAPRLDLTAAARYDNETYKNTQYTDQTLSVVLPAYQNGVLVDTQRQTADAFQPKGQLSYHFTDDTMGYLTISRGFRAGFFSSALYTLPEHTTNYEIGFKSTSWDRRVVSNAAVFYIDYANQQFYETSATPPFVVTVTIPKTNIEGAELEETVLASRFVTFGAALGYTRADVTNDGGWSPDTPRFNATEYVDFTVPAGQGWEARLHVDDRYNSLQYLAQGNTNPNPAKNFVNLRAGVRNAHYDIAAFVRNATNTREQTQAGAQFPGGFVRFENEPRSYGIEIRLSF